MRTLAYCCQNYAESTRKAAGVLPITCPPTTDATILQRWHGPYHLIYLDLHGQPGARCWYGDNGIVALREEQVRRLSLRGAVVFAVNCYLGDEDSPMLDALLDAGAKYVIGGEGRNWGGKRTLLGAARLGRLFRLALAGMGAPRALALAKAFLRLEGVMPWSPTAAIADALQFKAFYRV